MYGLAAGGPLGGPLGGPPGRAAAGRALRRSRKAGRERVSEGGMMRLETFMELKFLNSSLSSSSSR